MSRLQHNDTVVIVGGGSIGLSTAYNLAKDLFNSLPKIRIIVIDAFDQPFLASSSTCTGCFHYAFPEQKTQPLLPLGKYSFDLWEAEAEKEAFNKLPDIEHSHHSELSPEVVKVLTSFQTGCRQSPSGMLMIMSLELILLLCE